MALGVAAALKYPLKLFLQYTGLAFTVSQYGALFAKP